MNEHNRVTAMWVGEDLLSISFLTRTLPLIFSIKLKSLGNISIRSILLSVFTDYYDIRKCLFPSINDGTRLKILKMTKCLRNDAAVF